MTDALSPADPLTEDQFIGLVRILRTADGGDWSEAALRRRAASVPGGWVRAAGGALGADVPRLILNPDDGGEGGGADGDGPAGAAPLPTLLELAGRALDEPPGTVGGGPTGPFARWRDRGTTLHLTPTRLELRRTDDLERDEWTAFEWGPSDPSRLPYTWLVCEAGPGAGERVPDYLPAARPAADLAEAEEALAGLLRALCAQLPQFGEEAAVVVCTAKEPTWFVQFVADARGRLHAEASGTPGPAWHPVEGRAGLHFHDWVRPDAEQSREAAALMVDALRRLGVRRPDELRIRCWTQAGNHLRLAGLGLLPD
ncbi:hypothetical protein BIV57_08185 [Mangrovactinospora gilvigrisea]|uniref:Uncharacterized protein n=1 Tax=Mangrovactinospora gilvigrisea TaxID=1428644 RepID=A0A1J7C8V2_9ACTN|nr:hypothetical protein [Mangrovactinospora gilvigrisea]OIV37956.1 hypothetical protein BIV57_08185 [Mangrovactinospora gilvigrisea]